jgi:predicted ATPase
LKDIDINVEKDFFPRIFPLGSLNGGGKSTLLQLIFILLHCSLDPEKHEFIRNLLERFSIPEGVDKRILATFEIWDGEKIVNLEFFACQDSYVRQLANSTFGEDDKDVFDSSTKLLPPIESWLHYRKVIQFRKDHHLKSSSNPKNQEEREHINRCLEDFNKKELFFNDLFGGTLTNNDQNLKYICDYSLNLSDSKLKLNLICSIESNHEINSFLQDISGKIFLAAPSTQVFLFLNPEYRKLLFQQNQENENYFFRTQEAKSKLINFYPYDALSVDILINTFKRRRDQDFEVAIETGQYGNNYESFLNDVNTVLIDKKINIAKGLSSINFKAERNGEIIELYPEDLSHGELKRLSLYVWLKYSNIENAIILFDEIEIALHPDWQYQIIRDLEEWGPTNQYILATHSYALCEALTPAHVKEIEPKLLNQINN